MIKNIVEKKEPELVKLSLFILAIVIAIISLMHRKPAILFCPSSGFADDCIDCFQFKDCLSCPLYGLCDDQGKLVCEAGYLRDSERCIEDELVNKNALKTL